MDSLYPNLNSNRPKTNLNSLYEPFQFADLLKHYLDIYGYTPGQLSRLSGLPKSTIVNWMNGRVTRPRTWQQVAQLARAMRLATAEMNHLLKAASFPVVRDLRQIAHEPTDQHLLTFWQESASLPVRSRTPFQAIPDLPYFVGRDSFVAEIRQALSAARHDTFYLIYGMGGVGKTVLATRIAYLCRANFPDGVLWVQVNSSEPMTALLTIAQAYGQDVREFDTLSDRSRAVRELLADKRALMILDNAETDEQIVPFLPPTGPCAVLITSRRQDLFTLTGTKRWFITPFSPDDPANQQIFIQFLGKTIVRETAETITSITHLLGGLPLALAIVASRLAYEPGWSPAQFAARLQQTHHRLRELAHGEQSIRASFEISFTLLAISERQFFIALSLFPTDFSPEAAAQITNLSLDETQDLLRHLYRLSMIQITYPGRFRLHPLLRDFATEQIANLPEQEKTFTQYTINFVACFVSYLKTHATDFMVLQVEHENLLAALEQARRIQPLLFVTGVKTIHNYLLTLGLFTIGQTVLEQALSMASSDRDQIDLLLCLSQLNREQAKVSEAGKYAQRALRLAQAESTQLAAVLTELGICTALEGNPTAAVTYFEQGLRLAQELGDTNLLPTIFLEIGIVTCRQQEWAQALEYYQQGLTIAESQNSTTVMAMLYKSLGALHLLKNEYLLGQQCLQKGLTMARDTLNFPGVILAANNLAVSHLDLVEPHLAASLLQEAQAIGQRFGNVKWLCIVEYNLGLLAKQEGDKEKERKYFERATSIAQKLNIERVIRHIEVITQSTALDIKAHTLLFL